MVKTAKTSDYIASLCPTPGHVLVRLIAPEEKTPGGIVLAAGNQDAFPQRAEVIACGRYELPDGTFGDPTFARGVEILIDGPVRVQVPGTPTDEKYFIIQERSIVAGIASSSE